MTFSPAFNPSVTIHLLPTAWPMAMTRASALPSAPTTITVATPFAPTLTPRWRTVMALAVNRLLQPPARKHSRQEQMIGIGKLGPQRDHAAARVHRDIGEQKFSGLRVSCSVIQQQRHLRLAGRGAFKRAAVQFAPQPKQLGARFGEIAINRIQLLDHGHFSRGALADQRTFGDQRRANAAVNRRSHFRVTEIDRRRFHRRLGRQHIGVRLRRRRHGVVVILFANGVDGNQRLIAIRQLLGLFRIGLRLGKIALALS